ncbi:hypothetical protein GN244_ATG06451 [Phytophthora infestans]|uniref:Uncharacterized protein n=1 Tax=Phytophthora infestans TaxID=4787 RepID=A0A833TI60_PHYIN|nr:hypothetical protein GN244_ATG06451 [Phytophthora infestans]KAF4149680.1 hypothetical protein GN958_ATG01076 [Phytophthora infestans]
MTTKDGNAVALVANTIQENNIDESRRILQDTRLSLAPWTDSDDYKNLPGPLKLGIVHLLNETLTTADSPHTSKQMLADTLALANCGAQYLGSHDLDKCTMERLDTHNRCRDQERRRLDVKAANLVLTWRCQRLPTQGMPPLELKTSDYLIPELQDLRKAGGSAVQAATEVNEDALRAEIKRYSITLRRRVEVRQQELVRDLQRHQRSNETSKNARNSEVGPIYFD